MSSSRPTQDLQTLCTQLNQLNQLKLAELDAFVLNQSDANTRAVALLLKDLARSPVKTQWEYNDGRLSAKHPDKVKGITPNRVYKSLHTAHFIFLLLEKIVEGLTKEMNASEVKKAFSEEFQDMEIYDEVLNYSFEISPQLALLLQTVQPSLTKQAESSQTATSTSANKVELPLKYLIEAHVHRNAESPIIPIKHLANMIIELSENRADRNFKAILEDARYLSSLEIKPNVAYLSLLEMELENEGISAAEIGQRAKRLASYVITHLDVNSKDLPASYKPEVAKNLANYVIQMLHLEPQEELSQTAQRRTNKAEFPLEHIFESHLHKKAESTLGLIKNLAYLIQELEVEMNDKNRAVLEAARHLILLEDLDSDEIPASEIERVKHLISYVSLNFDHQDEHLPFSLDSEKINGAKNLARSVMQILDLDFEPQEGLSQRAQLVPNKAAFPIQQILEFDEHEKAEHALTMIKSLAYLIQELEVEMNDKNRAVLEAARYFSLLKPEAAYLNLLEMQMGQDNDEIPAPEVERVKHLISYVSLNLDYSDEHRPPVVEKIKTAKNLALSIGQVLHFVPLEKANKEDTNSSYLNWLAGMFNSFNADPMLKQLKGRGVMRAFKDGDKEGLLFQVQNTTQEKISPRFLSSPIAETQTILTNGLNMTQLDYRVSTPSISDRLSSSSIENKLGKTKFFVIANNEKMWAHIDGKIGATKQLADILNSFPIHKTLRELTKYGHWKYTPNVSDYLNRTTNVSLSFVPNTLPGSKEKAEKILQEFREEAPIANKSSLPTINNAESNAIKIDKKYFGVLSEAAGIKLDFGITQTPTPPTSPRSPSSGGGSSPRTTALKSQMPTRPPSSKTRSRSDPVNLLPSSTGIARAPLTLIRPSSKQAPSPTSTSSEDSSPRTRKLTTIAKPRNQAANSESSSSPPPPITPKPPGLGKK